MVHDATWGSALRVCSCGLDEKIEQSKPAHPDRSDHKDHVMTDYDSVMGDYDSWITTLTEASARLDGLQTAVTEVRHLLRGSQGVPSTQIMEVLDRHGV